MPLGIEKVVIVNGSGTTTSTRSFVMKANEIVEVKAQYYPDTPEAEKGYAKWIVKPKEGAPYSKNDQQGKIGDTRGLSVKPKYCGPKQHIVEAFIDHPKNIFPFQIEFKAIAPQRIISSKWSKTKGGSDIRNTPIKYGDDVWLFVETEGLNGAVVDIDIHLIKGMGRDDPIIAQLGAVPCIHGEINVQIKDTYAWKSNTGMWTSSEEEIYVKIRLKGKKKTIQDKKGDDEHARFLRIEDEVSTREVELHDAAKPLKIGETEVNVERYELCRFKKIVVTDNKKDIVLFEEGKLQLEAKAKSGFNLSETIHFDLDKAVIRPDAKEVLDGVATLLLDNPYVPAELGAHCDIRADDAYNDALSQLRAAAAVEYLVTKGVSKKLLFARGYGKRRLLVEGEEISEEEHQLNRRVTIKFRVSGADAESIVFETIAPDDSKKKKITLNIDSYNTDKCLGKGAENEHATKVMVTELTPEGEKGPFDRDGTGEFKYEVYANLSKLELVSSQTSSFG